MIILKSQEEIEKITVACRIVGRTLAFLRDKIKPGLKTIQIDRFAADYIRDNDAMPAFKGYRGYPANICASVNNEVIHGIPSDRVLNEGDILGVDLGVYKDGFYGDAAYTFPVGEINGEAQRLLKVTEEALYKGIKKAKLSNRVSDISYSIQKHVEANGYTVVRAFVGHGIGRDLHEDPQIPNFGDRREGPVLRRGMTLAIEPMVNAGNWRTKVCDDQWTVVTADGSLSAHFEHTIAVTNGRAEILTVV